MAVKIGHASIDENQKAHGGKAGDQTGKEVYTREWYAGNWDFVLRCKESKKATAMAKACEAACANPNIGYDQYERNTLLTQAKKCNWDLSKITTACECDCSSLMAVCAQCAGIDVPYVSGNAPYTGNMKVQFLKTGVFDVLAENKYLVSSDYLKRGDILVRESGHTAMVLSNGAKAKKSGTDDTAATGKGTIKVDPARYFKKDWARTWTVCASRLNLRCGAGTDKTILNVLNRGDKVTCYGYYSNVASIPWLLVVDNDGVTGFCSKNYLE